jgi:hypothetical protein
LLRDASALFGHFGARKRDQLRASPPAKKRLRREAKASPKTARTMHIDAKDKFLLASNLNKIDLLILNLQAFVHVLH